MNELYRALNTTKQNIHQRLNMYLRKKEEEANLAKIIHEARKDHPAMGALSIYQMLKPSYIGRDRFRQWYNEGGFKLFQVRNYRRTTDSSGVIRFPNLVTGLELNRVNQVFVSDITYYEMNNKWYYLTFIMDLHTRVIKGYSASPTLRTTDTTIPALSMALAGLKRDQTEGLIIHSDGGGQYYCKEFLQITHNKGLKNSMCESVYENSHAERVNGTIKNNYLKHYNPQTFAELTLQLAKAVNMYNNHKPHESLKGLTPAKYEQLCTSNPQKTKLLTKKKEAKKKHYNNINTFS